MHQAISTKTRGFSGPVTRDENPRAHGNVCEIERCSCGAERRVNVNGMHVEEGDWDLPHERVNVQAVAATPDQCRRYLVDAAGSTRGAEIIAELLGNSAEAVIRAPHRGDDASTVQIARLVHARLG